MPSIVVNGVRLHHALHGSWGNHRGWDAVALALAERHRVLAYDRRGHSQSGRPAGPGSSDEDGDDLAALIEALGLAPPSSPAAPRVARAPSGWRRDGRSSSAV